MDGFKSLPKMKCGGSVDKAVKKCGGGFMKKGGKYKEGGDVDLKQDKALIKKAFKQHDKAEHDKEPTEIKLKKGGRGKKEVGSVKKYKAGGAIEMKKSSGDLDTIKKVKATGAKKADAPSKATERPALKGSDVEKEKSKSAGDKDVIKKVPPTGDKKASASSAALKGEGNTPAKFKKGGHIKHMADGALAGPIAAGRPAPVDPRVVAARRLARQQAMRSAGLGRGMAAPQAPNPNAMNTTFNAVQPPAYPSTANDVMNNPYSRSGLNTKAVDALLNSPEFTIASDRMTDQ